MTSEQHNIRELWGQIEETVSLIEEKAHAMLDSMIPAYVHEEMYRHGASAEAAADQADTAYVPGTLDPKGKFFFKERLTLVRDNQELWSVPIEDARIKRLLADLSRASRFHGVVDERLSFTL